MQTKKSMTVITSEHFVWHFVPMHGNAAQAKIRIIDTTRLNGVILYLDFMSSVKYNCGAHENINKRCVCEMERRNIYNGLRIYCITDIYILDFVIVNGVTVNCFI